MDEVNDEEDYDQFNDYPMEEERGVKHLPRQRRSTFPNDDIAPWLRRSHNKIIVNTGKKITKIHVKTVSRWPELRCSGVGGCNGASPAALSCDAPG